MKKNKCSYFNWGPCVVKFKMEDDFKKLLLDEAKKKCFRFQGQTSRNIGPRNRL